MCAQKGPIYWLVWARWRTLQPCLTEQLIGGLPAIKAGPADPEIAAGLDYIANFLGMFENAQLLQIPAFLQV